MAFRQHTLLPLDDCLHALQATFPRLTRSSLHRCLERHGISRLPEVEGDMPGRKLLPRRHLSETALLVEIRAVYTEARGAYGSPSVWRQLKATGVRVGKRRVELAMRQNGLRGRGKAAFSRLDH